MDVLQGAALTVTKAGHDGLADFACYTSKLEESGRCDALLRRNNVNFVRDRMLLSFS